MKKRKNIAVILITLIVVVALLAVYMTYFYTTRCSSLACFNNNLKNCEKASFLNDDQQAAWQYEIIGLEAGNCKINVKLLQLKKGEAEIAPLQGQSMDCYLPFKRIQIPHEDLEICHGILKEEIQSYLIKRMHKYVIDHIGEISEELEKII